MMALQRLSFSFTTSGVCLEASEEIINLAVAEELLYRV
jgi:hypothetical protein